jgi:hypothetical protein
MDQSPAQGVVLASPWVLSFSAQTTARWAHVGIGLIVAVLAGLRLWFMHQTPRQRAGAHDKDVAMRMRAARPARAWHKRLAIRRHCQERVQGTPVQGSASR